MDAITTGTHSVIDVGPKPYHLTLLDTINEIEERSPHRYGALMALAHLIKATKLPQGQHRVIEDAWMKKTRRCGYGDFDVPRQLRAHMGVDPTEWR